MFISQIRLLHSYSWCHYLDPHNTQNSVFTFPFYDSNAWLALDPWYPQFLSPMSSKYGFQAFGSILTTAARVRWCLPLPLGLQIIAFAVLDILIFSFPISTPLLPTLLQVLILLTWSHWCLPLPGWRCMMPTIWIFPFSEKWLFLATQPLVSVP